MIRTAFLVDGFNLYHSLRDASRDLDGAGTRWLDLRGLCQSHLAQIDPGARLASVTYFSALAHHLEPIEPGLVARHLVHQLPDPVELLDGRRIARPANW